MTKGLSCVTPTDLAHRLGVTPLQVRRVLRSLYGTLERQDRGGRWHLTPAEGGARYSGGQAARVVLNLVAPRGARQGAQREHPHERVTVGEASRRLAGPLQVWPPNPFQP